MEDVRRAELWHGGRISGRGVVIRRPTRTRHRRAPGPPTAAQLLIYSLPNETRATPARYLRDNLKAPRAALDYQRVTSSFFAISGASGGTIYYSRCNFSSNAGGAVHCFDLKYPEREKRAWDDVVTRISRSLRPLVHA